LAGAARPREALDVLSAMASVDWPSSSCHPGMNAMKVDRILVEIEGRVGPHPPVAAIFSPGITPRSSRCQGEMKRNRFAGFGGHRRRENRKVSRAAVSSWRRAWASSFFVGPPTSQSFNRISGRGRGKTSFFLAAGGLNVRQCSLPGNAGRKSCQCGSGGDGTSTRRYFAIHSEANNAGGSDHPDLAKTPIPLCTRLLGGLFFSILALSKIQVTNRRKHAGDVRKPAAPIGFGDGFLMEVGSEAIRREGTFAASFVSISLAKGRFAMRHPR